MSCLHGRAALALLSLSLVLIVTAAAAQEPKKPPPPPPDTLPADTMLRPPADTAAAQAPVPAVPEPVIVLPPFPDRPEAGWSAGIWTWDRNALLLSGAITLAELLERLPGMAVFRAGHFGAPEGVSAFGGTGGRLELVLDGFVLDALSSANYDLARVELVQLQAVRVERRLGVLRIELETLMPGDARPYTLVEAGTGFLDTNLFRGTFLHPRMLGGYFGAALERLDSDGRNAREPATTFDTWLKWGVARARGGVQLEFRRTSLQRGAESIATGEGTRNDLLLRGRLAPRPELAAEVFVGRSTVDDDFDDGRFDQESIQYGGRVAYVAERIWTRGTVRARTHDFLPGLEAELALGARLPGAAALSGDVRWSDWEPRATLAVGARAELGPFHGLRAFAELDDSERGAPFLLEDPATRFSDMRIVRAGAELSRGGLQLGGAFVRVTTDSLPSFGLPFDRTRELFRGGEVTGWEAAGRLPLLWAPLSIQGSLLAYTSGATWIYLPVRSWNAALVYHHLPLPSGNLEILAQLQARFRGLVRVPTLAGELRDGGAEATEPETVVPALTLLDFYLQIRVIDVRLFVRWENITHRLEQFDLPGRTLPGQRVLYGVKWQFFN